MTVPLSDNSGRSLRIHYLCAGPSNSSSPTILFESDYSHGYADFYGLQLLLTQAGRRSCIWDKPGLGYSDFLFSDMNTFNNYLLYYNNFIRTLARTERAPFVWVGWGGGGSIVYDFASRNSDLFASITYLDVYPVRTEWVTPSVLKNLTLEQTDALVKSDMANRFGIESL